MRTGHVEIGIMVVYHMQSDLHESFLLRLTQIVQVSHVEVIDGDVSTHPRIIDKCNGHAHVAPRPTEFGGHQ